MCRPNIKQILLIAVVAECPEGDICCSSKQKCNEDEGHCVSDDDCKQGLKCGKNNCRKQKGLQRSDWMDSIYWTDNCCENKNSQKGNDSSNLYIYNKLSI